MAEWKRRGNYQDLTELVMEISGMSLSELTVPEKIPACEIDQIPEAAELVINCLEKQMPVVIVGDYDVDGITSTAILVQLLQWYACTPRTIIPKRFTDGYGISERLLEGIHDSLIITVDNGISANQPLKKAREAGNRVLVLDHHQSSSIPEADVVVDPHVTEGPSSFKDYCGAGLALKLAEQLLPYPGEYPELFYNLTVLACLGTISDVMPLRSDNRRIVREGLQIMRSKRGLACLTAGLQEILKLAGSPMDEESVKFTIGPVMNAVGRMYDAGSTSALKAVLCRDSARAAAYVSKMKEINEDRKTAVSHWQAQFLAQADPDQSVQVLYLSGVPEGILGIIAGKVTETLRMPAFVFSDAAESGIYKGSGRSFGEFDLFSVIEEIRPLTVAAGGHAGAAGLSICAEQFAALKSAIEKVVSERGFVPGEDVLYYDLELRATELSAAYEAQSRLAPFGEGCPQPVVLLKGFHPVARGGDSYRFMGANGQHVKLQGPDFEVVVFNRGNEFRELGLPDSLDIVGTLGVNVFNGRTTVQVKPLDFRASAE